MSVSKQHHESIPFPAVEIKPPQRPAIPPRNKLSILPPGSDPEAFWAEFNRTLDEFFHTIDASKDHIRELSERVAERDTAIELLEAENAALRDQVAMKRLVESQAKEPVAVPQKPTIPKPAPIPESIAPTPVVVQPEDDARGGIWRKLLHLERDGDEQDD